MTKYTRIFYVYVHECPHVRHGITISIKKRRMSVLVVLHVHGGSHDLVLTTQLVVITAIDVRRDSTTMFCHQNHTCLRRHQRENTESSSKGGEDSRSFFDHLNVCYTFKTICLLTRVHRRRTSERDDAPHKQADRNRGEGGPSDVRRSRQAENQGERWAGRCLLVLFRYLALKTRAHFRHRRGVVCCDRSKGFVVIPCG